MKLSLDRGKLKSRWIITPLFIERIPVQITTFTKMMTIKCSPLILLRPAILLIILYYTPRSHIDLILRAFDNSLNKMIDLTLLVKAKSVIRFISSISITGYFVVLVKYTFDSPISF
jgi:hypothetical protein